MLQRMGDVWIGCRARRLTQLVLCGSACRSCTLAPYWARAANVSFPPEMSISAVQRFFSLGGTFVFASQYAEAFFQGTDHETLQPQLVIDPCSKFQCCGCAGLDFPVALPFQTADIAGGDHFGKGEAAFGTIADP